MSKVYGQPEGVQSLRKVIEGKVATPLLLIGSSGVGRRFSVVQAVKEDFSKGNPESVACLQIDHKTHSDFSYVEPEEDRDLGIDAIRDVIQQARDFPMVSARRYIAIEGVDRLTAAAANAILKTLEEPPELTRFLLIAENYEAVLPTIRSRCAKVRYRHLEESFIVDFIKGSGVADSLVCARLAEGSLGRAFEYSRANRLVLRNQVLELLKIGLTRDIARLFLAVDEIKDDLRLGIQFLNHILYDLAMIPHDPTRIANLDVLEDLRRVGKSLPLLKVRELQQDLRTLQGQTAKVGLDFHVKSCLASVFLG